MARKANVKLEVHLVKHGLRVEGGRDHGRAHGSARVASPRARCSAGVPAPQYGRRVRGGVGMSRLQEVVNELRFMQVQRKKHGYRYPFGWRFRFVRAYLRARRRFQ